MNSKARTEKNSKAMNVERTTTAEENKKKTHTHIQQLGERARKWLEWRWNDEILAIDN